MPLPIAKALRANKARLDAQIKRRLQLQRTRERKLDTRRKVLVGALVLGWMAQREALARRIYRALDRALVRPIDRAAFGDLLSAAQAQTETQAHV